MSENIQHNHLTRDIKPKGQCPSCDKYHQSRMEDRWREEFEKTIDHGNETKSKDPSDCWIYHNPITQWRWESYLQARRTGRELAMISIEAHLYVYNILKNELAKYVDVEKFLDENVEM